jgi:two-component system phosphate regulon sensor histidine kinase PhoR
VVVARDTTETTRLSQMRRDFVANVSHELKTPLSAIRGYAETLRDGALAEPDTAARFTARILDQCRRLQELLDDLLTLSRLESVEVPLEARPVDLARLADQCLETISPYARERGVALVRAPSAGGLPPVTGDRGALERLLLNLLENAVKYNREGGEVRLRVGLESGGDGGGGERLVVEVADTGIGIPQAALPRIFERFYRVDKGRARGEGGTGLGLAIVKHVAQAHGGRVEVDSRHRHGSTFRVFLPPAAVARDAAVTAPAPL